MRIKVSSSGYKWGGHVMNNHKDDDYQDDNDNNDNNGDKVDDNLLKIRG